MGQPDIIGHNYNTYHFSSDNTGLDTLTIIYILCGPALHGGVHGIRAKSYYAERVGAGDPCSRTRPRHGSFTTSRHTHDSKCTRSLKGSIFVQEPKMLPDDL